MQAPQLLIVDGDDTVRQSLHRILTRQGFAVVLASSMQEGITFLQQYAIDLALVDVGLEGDDGPSFIREAKRVSAKTEVIALTGEGAAEIAFRVLSEGACDYFEKPISDWQRFYQTIRKNLEIKEKSKEIFELRARCDRLEELRSDDEFGQLIGNSPAMRELQSTIAQVGPHNVSVLVVGESGSGKERVARALHAASKHQNGPFVAINCAGLQKDLLESELFGYERGAHSTADKQKQGLFEIAEQGTVFLDEIGEMPYDMQAKLLRVLNEREFRRVGGTRILPLRARIISATNVDLRDAIRNKLFREDLYYRLNVFEISVPPLRDRTEDIPLLAYYFIQKYNNEYDMSVRRIHPSALNALKNYNWHRNNVRELERAIQRAVVLSNNLEELPLSLFHINQEGPPSNSFFSSESTSTATSAAPLESTLQVSTVIHLSYKEAKEQILQVFTQEYLKSRLQETNNNITKAAQASGMLRPNFAKLMKRFGIRVSDLTDQHLKG